MNKATICLILLLIIWTVLPFSLRKLLQYRIKRRQLVFGNLYVRKTHKNGGPNPSDPSIDNIIAIDIPGIGDSLYIGK